MRGSHAVITGGSSGLGLELAKQLASVGVRATLIARDPGRLEQASADVRKVVPTAEVRTASLDISDAGAVEDTVAGLLSEMGPIDILINSAGILREGYFEQLEPADFTEIMSINFFGAVNMCRSFLPHLKSNRGRIVNISSVAGLTGAFGLSAYSPAKHALVGFTESLRIELEPQGVRVQLVCPPEFDSPMVDALNVSRTPENRAHAHTIPKMSVEHVARDTIRGIERNSAVIIPGITTRLLVISQRIAPGLGRVISRRRIARVYKGPTEPTGQSKVGP